METTTNTVKFDGLTEEQEKRLALAQHEGDDYFILDTDEGIKIFEGTEEDAREQYTEAIENLEKTAPTFEEWAADNCTELDEDLGDWLVLTDDEADTRNDEYIQNYIDDCVLPEIPKQYHSYFDEEAFKRDARMDGRGHNLASYDGHEHEETINGTDYYIYKN